MAKKGAKAQPDGTITMNIPLVPGTDEHKAYLKISRMYLAELAARQQDAADDEPCEIELFKSEVGRAAVIFFARVDPKELPELITSVKKKKGRPEVEDSDTGEGTTKHTPAQPLKMEVPTIS